MRKFGEQKGGNTKRSYPHARQGAAVFRVLIAVSLVAIAAGLLIPKLSPKRKPLTAFDEVGPGRINGGTCVSDFFGFSIELPHGWNVASSAELKQRLQKEDASDRKNVVFILLLMKYPTRSRGLASFNSGLFVTAERLSNAPEATTADTYLLESLESARKDGREIGQTRGPYTCTVGGKDFFGLDTKRRLQGRMVDTTHLAAVRKGYFFTIFAAWEGDADGSLLRKSLDSARFTRTARKSE